MWALGDKTQTLAQAQNVAAAAGAIGYDLPIASPKLSPHEFDIGTRLAALELSLTELIRQHSSLELAVREGANLLAALERTIEERTNRIASLEATIEERTHRLLVLERPRSERFVVAMLRRLSSRLGSIIRRFGRFQGSA